MAENSEVSKTQRFFDFVVGVSATDLAVRDWIYRLIIKSRAAIPASTAASMVLWANTLIVTGDMWPYYFIAADLAVFAVRMHLSYRHFPSFEARAFGVGLLAMFGILWGLILGLGAMTIVIGGDRTVTLSACAVIGGVIGVVSFRNASTPRAARILILVILTPVLSALWASGDFSYQVLATSVVPWAIALFAMINQNAKVIRDSAVAHIALHRAARIDALTGLWNRFRFNEYIDELSADKSAPKVSVLYLDLDGFKNVNDMYGHQVGDALLTDVAKRLHDVVRASDLMFRLGGDEFALLIVDATPAELDRIASRLLGALRAPLECSPGVTLAVSISIGSATRTGENDSILSTVRAADDALHAAKAEGKGRHVPDRRKSALAGVVAPS